MTLEVTIFDQVSTKRMYLHIVALNYTLLLLSSTDIDRLCEIDFTH